MYNFYNVIPIKNISSLHLYDNDKKISLNVSGKIKEFSVHSSTGLDLDFYIKLKNELMKINKTKIY